MKKRKELREAVAESANRIKSNFYLGMLLEVSELFRKYLEGEKLSDLQKSQKAVISDILDMKDAEKAQGICTFIQHYR